MKRLFCLLFAFAALASAQVYSTTISAGGTGYTTVPTVTASGGSCTSEPTLAATVSAGVVTAIVPTFAGIGCTSAPALAIGGPGTGAAAAAHLLPATIVILGTVPSLSGSYLQPSSAGQYTGWQFECYLIVPKSRVPFYASGAFKMPGTSQGPQYSGVQTITGLSAAFSSGVLTSFPDIVIVTNLSLITEVETLVQDSCTAQQAALNAWNPWAYYGSYFLNGIWTGVTVQ
jgi:hypothetical protein